MPSLHKDPRGRSPFWYAAYTLSDGRRCFRSTRTTDRQQAFEVACTWAGMTKLAGEGKLDGDTAREVIAGAAERILLAVGESMPSASVKDWMARWLSGKQVVGVAEGTLSRYKGIVDRFARWLGEDRLARDISLIRANAILEFRDLLAKELSAASVNVSLKTLRVLFGDARKAGLLKNNPAADVATLRMKESSRRNFSLDELKKILAQARGTEWETAIMLAIYTGQRQQDLLQLTWAQVDLAKREIYFRTKKTGKRLSVWISDPLLRHLQSLPSSDQADARLMPGLSSLSTSDASFDFRNTVLVPAGLAIPLTHTSQGRGRNTRRATSELSFHSCRHSLATLLRATGASDAIASSIVGHGTSVARSYTHMGTEEQKGALSAIPDLTPL